MQKYAFVLDINNVQLSPTKEEKAWFLIRRGRAKLIKRYPMVIQLKREQENTDLSSFKVGIDPGDTTGLAIVQESHVSEKNNKVIFKAEIQHRTDIKKKMTIRSEYRHSRRNEKRYRKPRFNNRASSGREGRIAPSIRNKKDEIIRVLNILSKYVRFDAIYCEDVSFDIRAMQMGYTPYKWQYQLPTRLDENIRKAVIARDVCRCKYCGAKGVRLEVHHITPKRDGGNNSIDNLITLCDSCHERITGNENMYKTYLYSIIGGDNKTFASASHVMIGKKYLYRRLAEFVPQGKVFLCTGGDTANRRIDWGILKSHSNDAVCITDVRCPVDNINIYVYTIKSQRRKMQTKQDTSGLNIKHRDLVWYRPRGRNPIKCYVTAILISGRFKGWYKLKSLDGERFGPASKNSVTLISSGSESLLFA